MRKPSAKSGSEQALGHSLTTEGLKKILIKTRDLFQFREYSTLYNKQDDGENAQDKKKKDGGKTRKDTLFGLHQTSNQEHEKPQRAIMPSNGKRSCPIPNCGASLNTKKIVILTSSCVRK